MSERKIVDYSVCETRKLTDLINYITSWIEEGWQPIGSVYSRQCTINPMVTYFYQSVVKYED